MCNCSHHCDLSQSQTKSQLRMITGKQHVIIAGKTLLLVEEDFARKCHHLKDSLVQNHDDSLHRSPGCALEIQKRKVPAAMCAIEKGKNRSGRLCPLFKQSHSGGKENLLMVVCVCVWGGEVVPGEEGIRERRSFSQLPSLRPKIWGAFLVTASPAIRSRLSLFYLSPSTHAASHLPHICTRIPLHTLCAALIYS